MGIKFDKDHLALKQSNYTTKLVILVYDLDIWPRNPTNTFKY